MTDKQTADLRRRRNSPYPVADGSRPVKGRFTRAGASTASASASGTASASSSSGSSGGGRSIRRTNTDDCLSEYGRSVSTCQQCRRRPGKFLTSCYCPECIAWNRAGQNNRRFCYLVFLFVAGAALYLAGHNRGLSARPASEVLGESSPGVTRTAAASGSTGGRTSSGRTSSGRGSANKGTF